jgi:hypothetical protein
MRTYTNVTVDRAIVHLVAPSTGSVTASQAELTLGEDVGEFLLGHIERGLTDGRAVAAAYARSGIPRMKELSDGVLEDGSNLVANSAELAVRLRDASTTAKGAKDERITDGTLIVARCMAADDGNDVTFLALLKLDPGAGWSPKVTTRGDRTVVDLVAQKNILPTPGERVQKAAFIRSGEVEYPLLVLDRQRRGDEVSDFFLSRFLEASEVLDAPKRTSQLYQRLSEARFEAQAEVDGEGYARIDQFVDGVMQGDSIDVDRIVADVPGPPKVKELFAEQLRTFSDRSFEADADTAAKLVQRKQFDGDNGLRVVVDAAFFPSMFTVQHPTADDPDFVIEIRTRTWKER